jgi:hypothetical protein
MGEESLSELLVLGNRANGEAGEVESLLLGHSLFDTERVPPEGARRHEDQPLFSVDTTALEVLEEDVGCLPDRSGHIVAEWPDEERLVWRVEPVKAATESEDLLAVIHLCEGTVFAPCLGDTFDIADDERREIGTDVSRHGREECGQAFVCGTLRERCFLGEVPDLAGFAVDDEGIFVCLDTEHDGDDAVLGGTGAGRIDAITEVFSRTLGRFSIVVETFAAQVLRTFREVIGGEDEAIVLSRSSVLYPLEKDSLKVCPAKLKMSAEISEWLDDANRCVGDDWQVKPSVHALETGDSGSMTVLVVASPVAHVGALVEIALGAVMLEEPANCSVLAFDERSDDGFEVRELHTMKLRGRRSC